MVIKPPVEPTPRRIVLSAGARSVEVEGPDSLDVLSRTASRLWKTVGVEREPVLWAGGTGFAAELAGTAMAEYQPDDDRVRGRPGIGDPPTR